jgi:hypothetical protein
MRKLFFIITLFITFNSILAQVDSLKKEKKIAFVFKLDNRFSYAKDQMISIYGFRTGVRLFGRHEFGVGFNWLGSQNIYEVPNQILEDRSIPLQGRFFYKYFGIFYEPIIYKKNRWTLSTPLQFGGGKAGIKIFNPQNNDFIQKKEIQYLLFEPTFNADYKFWRFLGIGMGAGYRFAFSTQEIVNESLSRPVFILKLKVYLFEIFDALKKKNKN